MNTTTIEWCRTYREDGTFQPGFTVNPVRFKPHGATRTTTMCQKISPGCTNCYAASIVNRFWPLEANMDFPGYTAQGLVSGDFVLDEKQLLSVLKSKNTGRVFWGDMTDLFGSWVPFEMLDKCFAVCGLNRRLTHIFLTKRPERMLEYMESRSTWIKYWEAAARELGYTLKFAGLDGVEHGLCPFPLPNVWLGTSVENQKAADERIPLLLRTPAAVRFISAEPLLGSVSLEDGRGFLGGHTNPECDGSEDYCSCECVAGLDWVICGGESGPGARPMMSRWADSIREQCEAARTAFFFKQNGQWIDAGHEEFGKLPTGKIVALRSDGTEWDLKDMPDDENADVTTMKWVTRERAGNTLYGKTYHAFPK